MDENKPYISGRGAQINPKNRFLKENIEKDPEHLPTQEEREELLFQRPKTNYIDVHPKTILNKVESPDLPDYSINPYQGCEHGCIYCYARNTHEYWGYSSGIDFESTILVKKNAAVLLEKALKNQSWKAAPIMLAGNTDIYQPIERKLGITRSLLEVFYKYRHPVGLISKNSLIERDLDILVKLAADKLVQVNLSLTTLDDKLKRILEPRTSSSKNILKTIERLSSNGIPVRVLMSPIIPSLTDHEIPNLVKAVADAGASGISYQVVRLNGHVAELFDNWIKQNYPDRASKILHQIMALHGGKLNDSRFNVRMKGEGIWAEMIGKQFMLARKNHLPEKNLPAFNLEMHKDFKGGQMSLF